MPAIPKSSSTDPIFNSQNSLGILDQNDRVQSTTNHLNNSNCDNSNTNVPNLENPSLSLRRPSSSFNQLLTCISNFNNEFSKRKINDKNLQHSDRAPVESINSALMHYLSSTTLSDMRTDLKPFKFTHQPGIMKRIHIFEDPEGLCVRLHFFQNPTETYCHNHSASFFSGTLSTGSYLHSIYSVDLSEGCHFRFERNGPGGQLGKATKMPGKLFKAYEHLHAGTTPYFIDARTLHSLIGKKPLLTVFVKGNHKINATVACSDKPKIADLSNLPEIEMTDHYEKEEMIMGIFRLCKDMRTPNFQGENLDTFHTEHAA